MKKTILLLAVFLFGTMLLSSCRLCVPEEITYEEEYKKIDDTGINGIDFTDCTADYVQSGSQTKFVYESMSSGNVKKLIDCLQNASMEKTDDYVLLDGNGYSGFRITLNSEEVIYLYYDSFNDMLLINGQYFTADENTINYIKKKIRRYRIQPNGLWCYQ